jgi:hypothetical protein
MARLLLGTSDTARRDALPTFVGPELIAVRWKQFRTYFADVAPGRSNRSVAHLLPGTGSSAAPMNGYPKDLQHRVGSARGIQHRSGVRVGDRPRVETSWRSTRPAFAAIRTLPQRTLRASD